MKLLLNTVCKLTAGQRAVLQAIRPGRAPVGHDGTAVDQLDGPGVEILVTEQVPRNLAAWPGFRWVQLLSAGSNQPAHRKHRIVISRGGIVPEPVLADALRSGLLAGADIDCYVKEPRNGPHEFFSLPNLLMTPPMSGVYEGFWDLLVDLLAKNLHRYQPGATLLNPVCHRLGY